MAPLTGGSDDFLDLKGEMEDLEDLEEKDIDRAVVALEGRGRLWHWFAALGFIPPKCFNFEFFRAEKRSDGAEHCLRLVLT